MRASRTAGFTLMELVISMAVLVVLSIGTGYTLINGYATQRLSAGYADDVTGMRKALTAVERDLRSARDVEISPDAVTVHLADDDIHYAIDNGRLKRNGRTLSRNVVGFDVTGDHGLFTATVTLGNRADAAARRPSVSSTVRPRAFGGAK